MTTPRRITNYVFADATERDTFGAFGTGVTNGDRCVLLSDLSAWVWDGANTVWRPADMTTTSQASVLYQCAVDNTLPTLPAALDLPIGTPLLKIDAGAANPLEEQVFILASRRMRPRRATLVVVTDAAVTGPAAAATIDVQAQFRTNPPPYGAFGTIETVGPEAVPVGSGFDSVDFVFSASSAAAEGDLATMRILGLDNADLSGVVPASEKFVLSLIVAIEWILG